MHLISSKDPNSATRGLRHFALKAFCVILQHASFSVKVSSLRLVKYLLRDLLYASFSVKVSSPRLANVGQRFLSPHSSRGHNSISNV